MPPELENMNAGNGIKRMESSEQAGYSLHLLYSYTMQTPGETYITFPCRLSLLFFKGRFFFPKKTPLNYSLVWTPFFSNLGAANDLLIFSSLFLFIQKTAANLLRATRWWDPSAGICKNSWLVSSANRTIIPTFDIVHHIRDIYVHTTPVPTLIVRTAKTKRPIG